VQLFVRLHESSKLLSRQTQSHSPGGDTVNRATQKNNSLLVNSVDSDVSMVDGGIETALNGQFFNAADFFRPDSIDDDDDDDNGYNTVPQSVNGSASLLSQYQVTP